MKEFLESVKNDGGRVWLEDDELRYRLSNINRANMLAVLRSHKDEVISLLRRLEHPQEQRVRRALGLNRKQQDAVHFPMRVEQMWLAELRKNGEAPKIPFDIYQFKAFGKIGSIELLRENICEIVSRHEALRSRMDIVNNRPVQLVENSSGFEAKIIRVPGDVLGRPDDVPLVIEKYKLPPIDPKSEISFRCRLFYDDERNVVIEFCTHYYFCDGWSNRILLGELKKCCDAIRNLERPALSPVDTQYGQFALNQRCKLSSQLSETLSFWEKELRNVPSLKLPHDHDLVTNEMATLHFAIPADLVGGLRIVARGLRVSLFTVMFAIYQLLMAKWSGQRVIATGVTRIIRYTPSLGNTFGNLNIAVPVCSSIIESASVSEFITQLNETLTRSYPYQELSYDLYDELFRPPQPFCPTLFNFMSADPVDVALVGDASRPPDVIYETKFPRQMHHRELYFELLELHSGDVAGMLFYNLDFYTRETWQMLVHEYSGALAALVRNPSQAVADLI